MNCKNESGTFNFLGSKLWIYESRKAIKKIVDICLETLKLNHFKKSKKKK